MRIALPARPVVAGRGVVWTSVLTLLSLGLSALFVLMPMARPGLHWTFDSVLHLYRVVEMAHLFRWGIWYSRWLPDLALGFGYPLFEFHSPLFVWAAAWLVWLGFSAATAAKLIVGLAMFAGTRGMYALARQWLARPAAILAAIAFVSTPYFLREIYGQGDYPQFLGLMLVPWLLLTLHRTLRTGERREALGFALVCALLLLSHNVTTLLAAGFVVPYVAAVAVSRTVPARHLAVALLAGVLAVAMTAFFWGPALFERGDVQLDRLLEGVTDFRTQFRSVAELVRPVAWRDPALGNGPDQLTIGLPQVVLGVLGLVVALATPGARRLGVVAAAGAGLAFWLVLDVSAAVWENVPLLAFVQFPWRWLGLLPIPLSLLIGAAAQPLRGAARGVYVPAAALILLAGAAPLLYVQWHLPANRGETICDLNRYEAQSLQIGLTSFAELLPKTVESFSPAAALAAECSPSRPSDRLDRASISPAGQVDLLDAQPLRFTYAVAAPSPQTLRFRIFSYPGWAATAGEAPLAVRSEPATGVLLVDAPAGRYQLTVGWTETDGRLAVDIVSLLAAALWLAGLATSILLPSTLKGEVFAPSTLKGGRVRSARSSGDHPATLQGGGLQKPVATGRSGGTEDRHRPLLLLTLALAAAVVVKAGYVDPATSWFRAPSAPGAPAGMTHRLDVVFGNAVELLGYRLDPEQPGPGAVAHVTLYWRPLGQISKKYSSFIHLSDWGDTRGIAASDNYLAAALPTDRWELQFYYQDTHELRLPQALEAGAYRLKIGMYETGNPGAGLPNTTEGRPDLLVREPLIVREGRED